MMVSDLIKELTEALAEHGDRELALLSDGDESGQPVLGVVWSEDDEVEFGDKAPVYINVVEGFQA